MAVVSVIDGKLAAALDLLAPLSIVRFTLCGRMPWQAVCHGSYQLVGGFMLR